ncbi:MAG: hypothetical protein L6264_10715 [Weeksellaceae bacterium]|nr:hypothetical protein [Bacteroidota bacterium]MCG2781412.1 hypothetical protein [Weeksellaceae bacterium]
MFLLISVFGFAQEKPNKLGVFGTFDANVGFDLGDIIRTNQAKTDYEKSQLPPGKFNYGFSSQIGFQPLNWFALGGGLRYSYIDPNYHMLYAMVQPTFFIGDRKEEDFLYIYGNYGTKINQTATKQGDFVGLGIGKIEPLGKHFGHKFQIYLEDQILDNEGNIFIGLSYGIVIFSNKNL